MAKSIPNVWKPDGSVNDGQQWVLDGEGWLDLMWDGEHHRVLNGELWIRVDLDQQDVVPTPPVGWVAHEPQPVDASEPWQGWQLAAIPDNIGDVSEWGPGSYEMVGPGIAGNLHALSEATLVPHGHSRTPSPGVWTKAALTTLLATLPAEGVIVRNPDGRTAKIRRVDLGLEWA